MENKLIIPHILIFTITLLLPISLSADKIFDWESTTTVNLGTGKFAPYYISSNNGGLYTQPITFMEQGKIYRELKTDNRFEYGFGADIVFDWSKTTQYDKYDLATQSFYATNQRPAYVWLQQLWADIKYRGVFLSIGSKEYNRSLFNQFLGSGDFVQSNNARPIPQLRAGFIDFQDIPFTNGWVQIQGEFAYGKTLDNKWIENHYNEYNSFITTNWWYHYSKCYFRTNPSQPFSVTVGMQHAAQFGGHHKKYKNGEIMSDETIKVGLKDFLRIFVPGPGSIAGDQEYHYGNHLGSWDLKLRYRFSNDSELYAYMQSPWEDGSGIGMMNGFDAIWGLEYRSATKSFLNGVVLEYIDLTNQSGPMHWAPDDHEDTQIMGEATGADDYYNNYMYNGWAYYGMSIGSPFIKSPLYNTDGYMRYTDNRVRGFHLGVCGSISKNTDYRILFSHRTSWGTPYLPILEKRHDTSLLIEATYQFKNIPNLHIKGQLAFDAGSLYGDNFGALVSLTYKGNFSK